ncbi:hypothetical protein [Metabacillus sp. RGM 3146]|uniref:hypothetical protein n=1 Tax=Metabacillus sp. RGM 3146 TaxID=3401092 RepID=UPI003B9B77AE
MTVVIFFVFTICFLLLAGTLHYVRLMQQTASYPPKRVLKQRAAVFGGGFALFLLVGILMYMIH